MFFGVRRVSLRTFLPESLWLHRRPFNDTVDTYALVMNWFVKVTVSECDAV
jgi:hypothetical protein